MNIFERYERHADITFDQAADQYLEEFTGKSLERQRYALDAIRPYIGPLRLIDVDDMALKQYKTERYAIRMAGTVNKEITTATAVMNKACGIWRYIPAAPKLQKIDGPAREAYPISWLEQAKLFAQMPMNLRRICVFAVNTGVRRAEIFKLKWIDERLINGVNLFILRETKNGKDRPVILNRLARRAVDSRRDMDETFVFLKQSISKPFNKAWVKAGLPDEWLIKKGIHNLRHTCGMRLRNAGVEPEDRDAILGHHNKSLTQHYALPAIERLGEIVERITKPVDMAVLR